MYPLGWRNDVENRTYLRSEGQDFLRMLPKMGEYAEQLGDPRPHVKIEDQGQQGSCTGHATSSIQEWLLYVETKGRVQIQLSRKFAYRMGQIEDNINGDNGATISGSIKAAKEHGNCEESLCPYTQQYSTDISEAAKKDALFRRIAQHQDCKGYDDIRRVVGTLFGGINIGVLITDRFMEAGNQHVKVITPDLFKKGKIIGGHSMALLLPSDTERDGDRPLIWSPQSWGTGVFDQGWMLWHPDTLDMLAELKDNELIAVTDIDQKHDDTGAVPDGEFTGRTIDFIKNNPHV